MTDVVDRATRSRMMSGIRGRDTKPELAVRKYLHAAGLRFRLKSRLPGKPDLVLPKYEAAVFVHGCYWHRHANCRFASTPSSNKDFWLEKFAANIERDKKVKVLLRNLGWRHFVVWECQLSPLALDSLIRKIID
ncbi:DNA mismatch endonuclease Vsr [Thermomonas sp.]|uniref:very short patch repair endonuclease n=1 Tax=Thermomonas sp. TaxID=1971895 RepID=UPI00248A8543|nr:DNA mismatch endonuclease Vsr [Thermomonas sp.]MDI1251824.1 DNA mismatch endonuclease Vsr [Thermomonas sp.]